MSATISSPARSPARSAALPGRTAITSGGCSSHCERETPSLPSPSRASSISLYLGSSLRRSSRHTTEGDRAKAAAYASELAGAPAAYHRAFFSNGTYGPTQTGNVMPLLIDAVPPALRARVGAALVGAVLDFPSAGAGPHPSGGGAGVRWVLQALTALNRTDLALEMASSTKPPSWGYFATTSPGTFWENWQQTTGSFNHVLFAGGVDPWLYHHVGGMRPPSPRLALGFGRGVAPVADWTIDIGVEAVVAAAVRQCSASLQLVGGRASVSWAFEPGGGGANATLAYEIALPFGHEASLTFPPAFPPTSPPISPPAVSRADAKGGLLRASYLRMWDATRRAPPVEATAGAGWMGRAVGARVAVADELGVRLPLPLAAAVRVEMVYHI